MCEGRRMVSIPFVGLGIVADSAVSVMHRARMRNQVVAVTRVSVVLAALTVATHSVIAGRGKPKPRLAYAYPNHVDLRSGEGTR